MWNEHDDAVRSMIRRAELSAVYDDGDQQLVDARGFVRDGYQKITRLQNFGHASSPPAGSQGALLSAGGRSDRAFMIGGEHPQKRARDTVPGGSVLYDASGNVIYAKADDGLVMKAKKGKVTVEAEPGKKVYLGGDGVEGSYARVMTESGPSPYVYARVS